MEPIYGVIEFRIPLRCSPEILGLETNFMVEGRPGRLIFPSLPNWSSNPDNPFDAIQLVAPECAKHWRAGDKLVYWGRPMQYPSGISDMHKALVVFEGNSSEDTFDVGNTLRRTLPKWIEIFSTYVEIYTKQVLTEQKIDYSGHDLVDIRYFDTNNRLSQAYDDFSYLSDRNFSTYKFCPLSTEHLKSIMELSSSAKAPPLEYRILLEAYRAISYGDYRKAVIEAASAVEIALTNSIRDEFSKQGINFGDALLKKYRTLGGRFELMKILRIEVANNDYKALLIEPRNQVVHRGKTPDPDTTEKVVFFSEELLTRYSPLST